MNTNLKLATQVPYIRGWGGGGGRERNVLFNDALNTFYLRLYGVRHMVKDHSDSEKGNPLPPHRILLSINSKGSFICNGSTPWRIDPTTHRTMSERSTSELRPAPTPYIQNKVYFDIPVLM